MGVASDLPDELWLIIFSYLNTVDVFQSFENLNQHFNDLVYDSAQHFILPSNVTNAWLETTLPLIPQPIQTLSFHESSLLFICHNLYYFSNIQSVNLEGNRWKMAMKLFTQPLLTVLKSSLKYLSDVTPLNNTLSNETRTLINYSNNEYYDILLMIQKITNEVHEDNLCPFIIRLSIEVNVFEMLSVICTRGINLRHLKIHYINLGFRDESSITQFDFSVRRASLRILKIISRNARNLVSFEGFLRWFDESLEKLVLDINSIDQIDGNILQSLCQPFQKLKRFHFFIESSIKNTKECFESFENHWWMNEHRFPIYIQNNTINGSIIASIPFLRSFDFENGLYNWFVNEDLNSSRIQFNTKQIHFMNKKSQKIDLKYLYFIDRIFSSFNQILSFDYPYLDTPDLLYQLVILLFF